MNLTYAICLHSIWMPKSSIRPIDWTLWSAITLGQSGLRRNDNEEVLHIPQSSQIWASPSYSLMSYPEHSLGCVLSLSRDVGGVFYQPNRLGWLRRKWFPILNMRVFMLASTLTGMNLHWVVVILGSLRCFPFGITA